MMASNYSNDGVKFVENSSINTMEDGPVSITKSDLPHAFDDNTALEPSPYAELPSAVPHGIPTGSLRRRRLIRASFPIFLVIVTVSVIVGITATDKKRSNSSYDYSDEPQYYLPIPPSDLDGICGPSNIETVDGRMECVRICQIADCCDYPTNLAISCFVDNQERCLQYMSSCVNLQLPQLVNNGANDSTTSDGIDSNLPSAPEGLPTTCAPYNLGTPEGMAECRSACQVAECCYQVDGTVESCINNPDCEQYMPCFFLGAADTIDDGDIKASIDATCSEENIATDNGLAECQIACSQAACCFMDNYTVCTQVDTQQVDAYCAQYSSCSVLLTYAESMDENTTIVDEDFLKQQVDAVCNDHMDDNLLTQCFDLCDSATSTLPYELDEYCPYGESGKIIELGDGSERKMCFQYAYQSCQIVEFPSN